jgi:DNA-directed RNA polymerase subunit RPC12/RpoP
MTPATPFRDDTGTTGGDRRCAGCGQTFIPAGRALHCSAACRKRVFRARHRAPTTVDLAGAPPQRPRREHTVYECPDCGDRQLGVQRCGDCGRFGRTVGLGGACPGCGEPVTVGDLGLEPRVAR